MFEPRFAELVAFGSKTQTIRPEGKNPPRAGEWRSLRVWTGTPRRSPQREIAQVRLTRVRSVRIHHDHYAIIGPPYHDARWYWVNAPHRLKTFARAEGFASWLDLTEWFWERHGLPFSGLLLEWKWPEI